MGNKHSPKLFIQTDQSFYEPGQVVTGSVYAHLPSPLITETLWLQIVGFEHCSRLTSIGGHSRGSGRHDYFNYKVPLSHWQTKLVEAGDYSFPFIFSLPSNLPGSLTLKQQGISAEISYKVVASFQGLDVTDEFLIEVVQPNTEALKPDHQSLIRPVRYFSCFNRGHVSLSARFLDRQMELGGSARVLIEIDNKHSDSAITHITCSLWRKLSIISNKGDRTDVRDLISFNRHAGVPRRGSLLSSKEFDLKLSINEQQAHRQLSSTEGQMINCSYYLEVAAAFESWMCSNSPPIVVMSPVTINSKNQMKREVPEIPEIWNPRIMPVANLGNSSRSLLSLSFATDN